ncbi:MAG: putative quinol monooxygenase [Methanobacteriaceae archaeon]
MIIVLAKASPKENMANNIINEAKSLIEATRAEKGCIEYNLYNPCDGENTLLFVEKWENKEYLKLHLEQDHFIKFGSAIGDFLARDLEISVYNADETDL